MGLSDSKLLIRDYSDIRDILRDIYIYGCFSRDDYINKGISGRKYDNEQRRITSYLPDKFIKKKREGKRVLPYCSYNMTETPENFLAETYRNKSFTLLDIMSYFFVLTLLNEGQGMTLPELLEVIPEENAEIIYTKDNLRKKLDELIEKGLIASKKVGRRVLYKTVEDSLGYFETQELTDIYWLLEFVKNVNPIEMPYFFLQRKLRLYLYANRGIQVDDIHTFQYKHNHLFNVLDNEEVLVILRAIHAQRELNIQYSSRGSVFTSRILPIRVIHECNHGRQYVLFYDLASETVKTRRIDRISSAEMMGKADDEIIGKAVKESELEESSWCTSGLYFDQDEVKIEFRIDDESEQYVIERIKREGKNGTIESVAPGLYLYTIMVKDPLEMTPWIRSFGERAKVVYSKDGVLEKHLLEDYERAISKYESI